MARDQKKKWATPKNPYGYKHGSIGGPRNATSRTLTRHGFTTRTTAVSGGKTHGSYLPSGHTKHGRLRADIQVDRTFGFGGHPLIGRTSKTSGWAGDLKKETSVHITRGTHYSVNPKKAAAVVAVGGAAAYGGYKAYQHRDQIKAKAQNFGNHIHDSFHHTKNNLGAHHF